MDKVKWLNKLWRNSKNKISQKNKTYKITKFKINL